MDTNHSLHKLFLISMFAVCSLAVIFLVRGKSIASARTSADAISNVTYAAGMCGSAHLKKIPTKPVGDSLCSSGQSTDVFTTNTGWRWYCKGTAVSGVVACEATLARPDSAIIVGTCGSADGQTFTTLPQGSALCSTGSAASVTPTDTGWNWVCGQSAAASVSCSANLHVAPIPDTNTPIPVIPIDTPDTDDGSAAAANNADTKEQATTTSGTDAKEQAATTSDNQNAEKNSGSKESRTKKIINQEEERNDAVVDVPIGNSVIDSSENISVDNDKSETIESYAQKKLTEKSEILKEPVIIEAEKLTRKNNPKVAGEVGASLKIESVALNRKDDGKNNLSLTGKSEPNALVTIYIFSKNPVVITIKADADGNWNYELDRELADGQHEAYVTVTDDEGRIVSRSEPVAFVKTAQAASLIPMSEFTGNQSPIENSIQKYVLMALIMMSVCLVAALILIGFLTHGHNQNEGIN